MLEPFDFITAIMITNARIDELTVTSRCYVRKWHLSTTNAEQCCIRRRKKLEPAIGIDATNVHKSCNGGDQGRDQC